MAEHVCNAYMADRKIVCPACSGMALLQEERNSIWCIDCGRIFRVAGIGVTDKEIMLKYER